MIHVKLQRRGTGKTNTIVEKMIADPNAVCVVPAKNYKDLIVYKMLEELYNESKTSLSRRVFTIRQDLAGLDPSIVYIDEAKDLQQVEEIANYFMCDIVAYGCETFVRNTERRCLQEAVKNNDY